MVKLALRMTVCGHAGQAVPRGVDGGERAKPWLTGSSGGTRAQL